MEVNACKEPVTDPKSLRTLINYGQHNRALNATRYNHTTSRTSVVVTIEITKENFHTGKLNLVDLAAAGKDQCLTDRMTYKNPINKCIAVFDKMVTIKAVKEATGTHKNDYIPCGESEITKILCNAFGGNSYTTLLCCIKPGNIYKEDTNQTL